MGEVALFVYGTLRPGEYNHAGDGETRPPLLDCTARGRIYFVASFGSYPVAKLDEEGIIHGDVLFLDDRSHEYRHIDRMERGAGYEPWIITVTGPDGTRFEASAWHYIDKPHGRLIEDGDWRKAYAEFA